MKRTKRIFLIATVVFIVAMLGVGYDISRRTTFPGSKPQLKERLLKGEEAPLGDSLKLPADTLR
jgi:hypothetical protein